MSRTSRSPRNPRPWLRPLAVMTALVTFVVAAGSAAYAVWSADATATGSVSAGRLTASTSGSLDAVLRNSELTVTRAVTFTNTTAGTSTRPAAVSVVFKAQSGHALLAELGLLTVWPTTNPALCTAGAAVGGASSQGNWLAGVTTTTSLARGASVSYCVRTQGAPGIGISGGTLAFVGRATATMSVGNFTTTVYSAGNLSTSHIYPDVAPAHAWYQIKPVGQSLCLDVNGGQNARPGAALGTWSCHTSADGAVYGNQWFAPQQFQSTAGSYLTLSTRLPAGTSLQAAGTGVAVQTTDRAVTGQQWSLQRVASDTYQLVSLATGLCVTAPASAGDVTLAACGGATNQQFTLTKVAGAPAPAVVPLMAVVADDTADELAGPVTGDGVTSVEDGDPQDPLDGAAGTGSTEAPSGLGPSPSPAVQDPARTERSPGD